VDDPFPRMGHPYRYAPEGCSMCAEAARTIGTLRSHLARQCRVCGRTWLGLRGYLDGYRYPLWPWEVVR
jgi:hypothetical protein